MRRRPEIDHAALPQLVGTVASLIPHGGGRGLRNAVGRWYLDQEADKLAYQVVKFNSLNTTIYQFKPGGLFKGFPHLVLEGISFLNKSKSPILTSEHIF